MGQIKPCREPVWWHPWYGLLLTAAHWIRLRFDPPPKTGMCGCRSLLFLILLKCIKKIPRCCFPCVSLVTSRSQTQLRTTAIPFLPLTHAHTQTRTEEQMLLCHRLQVLHITYSQPPASSVHLRVCVCAWCSLRNVNNHLTRDLYSWWKRADDLIRRWRQWRYDDSCVRRLNWKNNVHYQIGKKLSQGIFLQILIL